MLSPESGTLTGKYKNIQSKFVPGMARARTLTLCPFPGSCYTSLTSCPECPSMEFILMNSRRRLHGGSRSGQLKSVVGNSHQDKGHFVTGKGQPSPAVMVVSKMNKDE